MTARGAKRPSADSLSPSGSSSASPPSPSGSSLWNAGLDWKQNDDKWPLARWEPRQFLSILKRAGDGGQLPTRVLEAHVVQVWEVLGGVCLGAFRLGNALWFIRALRELIRPNANDHANPGPTLMGMEVPWPEPSRKTGICS